MQLKLNISSVSTTAKNEEYDNKMKLTYFMNGNDTDVLQIGERKYKFFYNLGDWAYETRIPNAHLCFGTSPTKFGTDYFAQIELSQALEDDLKIYIIKNISKLAGNGAITRINHGLNRNKQRKISRRSELVKMLNSKVIQYESQEWVIIAEINKADLFSNEKSAEVMYEFLNSLLQYALTIEEIIFNDNKEINEVIKGVVRD